MTRCYASTLYRNQPINLCKKHRETNFVDVSSDDDVALRGVHQRLEAIEVVGADDAARVRRLLG